MSIPVSASLRTKVAYGLVFTHDAHFTYIYIVFTPAEGMPTEQ